VPRIRPGKSVESEPKEGKRPPRRLRGGFDGRLGALARKQKLDTLGYLLEMARLEAESSARDETEA